MDAKIEYLKMIQSIITRMSHYGFLLKGWGVTLLAAILALSSTQGGQTELLLIGLFPIIIFWVLDAFFLHTEHKYRALYKHAAQLQPNEKVDFNLAPVGDHIQGVKSMFRLVFSMTLFVFWGALLVVFSLVYGVMRCAG